MTAARVRVHLFGRFYIWCDGKIVPGFDARKVQELFCYLLLHHGIPHSRESIAEQLGNEWNSAQSRKALRQTLWQLQVALDAPAKSLPDPLLVVEADWIQLDLGCGLWLDTAVFEEAFTRCANIRGQNLDSDQAQMLQTAVQLYGGDLLNGCYQDWCLIERERFQNMYIAMLDKLMDYCEARHDYEGGIQYGTRLLSQEPAHETTHRRLMRFYYLSDDRTSALRQYQRCMRELIAAFDVSPSERTVSLYERIRSDQPLDPSPLDPSSSTPSMATTPNHSVSDPRGIITQIHTLLRDLAASLERETMTTKRATTGAKGREP
jgi:DNA-binding SARP family transcriptional activator